MKNNSSLPVSFPKLNFSNFSQLCKQLYLSSSLFTKSQCNSITFPKLKTQESEQIEFQITSELCNCRINIFQMYSLLITKPFLPNQQKLKFPYSQEQFTLCLKRLLIILSNYNDCLFYFELNKSDFFSKIYHQINFISCHKDYGNYLQSKENKSSVYFKDNIETLYCEIHKMDDKEYSPIIKNLYFLIHIFMLFGNINYTSLTLEKFMDNLNLYNSLIFTDLKISILIHFHIWMLFSSMIEQFIKNDKIIPTSKKKVLINNKGMEIPTIYYLFPKNKCKDFIEQYACIFFQIQFHFKLYFIPILEEYFSLTYNFIILTFPLNIPQFNINKKQINVNGINLSNLLFTLNDVINLTQKGIVLNTLTVKIENDLQLYDIKELIDQFKDIVLSSKNIHFESNITKQHLEIEQMYSELTILQYILKCIRKIKNYLTTYFFRFSYNTFRLTICKQEEQKIVKRNIILYFSQELFDENKLLSYISQKNNIADLYTEYKQVCILFQKFKKYTTSIRLSKNNFVNEELKYYFNLLYLQIQNLIQDNKLIILYESDFISPQHTLIVNNITKHKNKIKLFNNSLKKFNTTYLSTLLSFYEKYFEYFNTVVVHDEINNNYPFNVKHVLRNFNENELIIVNKQNCKIDLIIYSFEKEHFNYVMEMIKNLRNDSLSQKYLNKITVIVNKQKFQEANYFANNSIFYSQDVSGIYVVNNQTNYDCYFVKKKITIISFNKVEDYFLCVTDAIYNNINMIKYICLVKKKLYYCVSIICGKKVFVFKNCFFMIKKISNTHYSSILETNITSSKDSYSLMTIVSIEQNFFILKNLFKLFEQNFIYNKTNKFENSKLKEIICNIIQSNSSKFKCVIYNQKYYDYMRKLLVNVNNNSKFKEAIIIPIKKPNEFNLHQEEKITISKSLNLFRFVNTKLNFFNIHDLSLPLSPSRLITTLNMLYNKRKNSVRCIFENKCIEKLDILNILLYLFSKKYKCNYLERKEFSQSIIKYIFKNECNVDIVGQNEGNDCNFVQIINVDFEIYAGEIHKYKKLKKVKANTMINNYEEKSEFEIVNKTLEEEDEGDKRNKNHKNK